MLWLSQLNPLWTIPYRIADRNKVMCMAAAFYQKLIRKFTDRKNNFNIKIEYFKNTENNRFIIKSILFTILCSGVIQ